MGREGGTALARSLHSLVALQSLDLGCAVRARVGMRARARAKMHLGALLRPASQFA